MANTVTISGMCNSNGTYFADSPVVITISGLEWPDDSPFKIVRVKVVHGNTVAGEFFAETGGQSSISFDISSALRSIWSDYKFDNEVAAANSKSSITRPFKAHSLQIFTEYIDSTDHEFKQTSGGTFDAGHSAIGYMTEWERFNAINTDASQLDRVSTKPTGYPERVGSNSITSIVSIGASGTTSAFYSPSASGGPTVLRDSMPYADFIFVNRRGAVETCSAQTFEALNINVETKQYGRVERPSFKPSRSLMAIASGGRKSWSMSSGAQTREWAEWWAMEFLMARQWWMRYPVGDADATYVPVIVEPAKKNTGIYDRSKQNMPSVEFTVTMALEG